MITGLLMLAAICGIVWAEFVAERHDGTRLSVTDPAFVASESGYTVGGEPVEAISRLWHNAVAQDEPGTEVTFPSGTVPRVAVLDMNERNQENEAGYENSRNLYSASYMVQVAGFPAFITDNLGDALTGADMIVLSSRVLGGSSPSFSDEEYDAITEWVKAGGLLIAPSLEPTLSAKGYALFGLEAARPQMKNHKSINWADEPRGELVYFNEPEERQVNIGSSLIHATEYVPAEADVLATFENGEPAVTRHSLGDGIAYTVGVKWRDVIQRPQLNKDDSSHGSSNVFVPGADIYALFVRAAYVAARPVAVWKYTVPDGYDAVLIPTHDCDSSTAYEAMHYMSDYEKSLGLKGHYFMTVHYYRDPGYLSQFYNPANIELTRRLVEDGHTVGSHSIGHFPDFNKTERFPMTEVTEEEYAATATCDEDTKTTTGGSTWAEIVMSKNILERDLGNDVRSFRSGHLCVNKHIPQALVTGNYSFASCYTAGDVMCGTPFFTRINNDWPGELTDVLQMPLHFSDVFSKDKMDENNWQEKPAVWFDIFNKLKDNHMSSIILIHPNREWKMEAEKMLVEMMDLTKSGLYNFEDYGDFWIGRANYDFDYVYKPDSETVLIRASADDIARNPALALMVEASGPVSVVTLVDETGTVHPTRITSPSPGRYLVMTR